jgi:hypothetical protein
MPGVMRLRVWDVEHGACVMIQHATPTPFGGEQFGRLAMIDAGDSDSWSPTTFIRNVLGRTTVDYLFITNADQDHMSDLRGLAQAGVTVDTLIRNPSYTGATMRAIKLGVGPLTGDAEWYVAACDTFNVPARLPFNDGMNGITCELFHNPTLFRVSSTPTTLAWWYSFATAARPSAEKMVSAQRHSKSASREPSSFPTSLSSMTRSAPRTIGR